MNLPPNVADIYPLSPIQQLTLLDCLAARDGQAHFEQLRFAMSGAIDAERVAEAWRSVVARHDVLRTAFVWRGMRRPHQVVHKAVELPFERHDLRALDAGARDAAMSVYMASDRGRGFNLSRAPLMRVAMFQTGVDDWQLLWSYHPLLIDGWSTALVLREFFLTYESLAAGTTATLPPVHPFRGYIAWLRQHDLSTAEAFWRRHLAGMQRPTPVPVDRPPSPGARIAADRSVEQRPDAALAAAVRATAQDHRLTIGTIVQGLWAVLLARYGGETDVAFGTAVSGRPATLSGATAMLGSFFNNVPVRARLDWDRPVVAWLHALQAAQLEASEHEHAPLAHITEWSGIADGEELFHSLVLCHNLPFEGTFWEEGRSFRIGEIDHPIRITHPLTLVCIPKLDLTLRVLHDGAMVDKTTAEAILGDAHALLVAFAEEPGRSLRAWANGIAPLAGRVNWRPERPAPAAGSPRPDAAASTDATATETRIMAIWAAVLGRGDIGLDDNLFELGARSIKVEQIFSRLQAEGFAGLSLIDMFEHPTIAALAAKIDGLAPRTAAAVPSATADEEMQSRSDRTAQNRARRRAARS